MVANETQCSIPLAENDMNWSNSIGYKLYTVWSGPVSQFDLGPRLEWVKKISDGIGGATYYLDTFLLHVDVDIIIECWLFCSAWWCWHHIMSTINCTKDSTFYNNVNMLFKYRFKSIHEAHSVWCYRVSTQKFLKNISEGSIAKMATHCVRMMSSKVRGEKQGKWERR